MDKKGNRLHALALHKAYQFLTDKNRRLFEITADFERFAQILLGSKYASYLHKAAADLNADGSPEILAFTDADYPPLLREISYAPFCLYLKGDRDLLKREFISMVGTREPSDAGRGAAAKLAKLCVQKNQAVVSGIARGVDGIAHHIALNSGGSTIAILPNGFNHLYPLENRDLYEKAKSAKNLLLISEYPPEQKPQRHHFVRRNRIIAGMSAMTIFVEGDVKSGAMITANYALSEGRDVAALSHTLLTQNTGGEKLIGDGAIDLTALAIPSEMHRVSA